MQTLNATEDQTLVTLLWILVLVLGVLSSELLLSIQMLVPGIWLYFATLLFCTLLPLRTSVDVLVVAGFAFLSAFRLVNLSMPAFVDLTAYWILLVYLPFAGAGTWFLWRSDIVSTDADMRGTLLWSLIAVVAGVGIATVESQFLASMTLLPTVTTRGIWLLVGVTVLGTVTEEVLFRGILQTSFRRHISPWLAVCCASLVFAVMQAPFGWVVIIITFVAGLIYGLVYELSGSLVTPVVCRLTVNVLLLVAIPVASARGMALPVLA